MVFGCDDHSFHTGLFNDFGPLAAIQFGRIKDIGRFIAVAPLDIGKRIWAKMNKGVVLHVVPDQLALTGNCSIRLWGILRNAAEKQKGKK